MQVKDTDNTGANSPRNRESSPTSKKSTAIMPMKTIVEERRLNLNCQVKFVDFEGRSDSASIINYLLKMRPRKIILVHGTTEATERMKYQIENNEICESDQILAPHIGECINMSSDINIYRALMHESLERNTDMHNIGGYSVAYLDAEVRKIFVG